MGDLTESSTPQPPAPAKQPPFREDCWSEEATWTLVDTWGRRYLELNRGNLRGKDWQEVADAVNSLHGHTKKTRRTDVQCKNRIDTLKKKYKVEKAKISDPTASTWPFFSRLDFLIGSANANKQHSRPAPPAASPVQTPLLMPPPPPLGLPSPPMAVPIPFRKPLTPAMVTPVVLPQKRPAVDESFFRRNYSAMAAAAAAAATEEAEEEDEESEGEGSGGRAAEEVDEGEDGVRRLAKAIERFGEIYEKVENMKQRQMVELEKQRMQFAKDLEVQRMRLFMDTQVQLEKLKQAKRSGSSGTYEMHQKVVFWCYVQRFCVDYHLQRPKELHLG
ncbi:sequence-specific DNA binding transcription factors [Striga hermonthica]|uniref:Sequence-specific DNA binding transcription factors n=1 Tax=Striga hermonthica TaxID=68872 RepID=A0A9N7NWI4_STRHE|nr:sequence-specific DNA binding transcription factors [Striga hermonthica]